MLPSKLRALNECSTDESSDNDDAPVKITKEALVITQLFNYYPLVLYIIHVNLFSMLMV